MEGELPNGLIVGHAYSVTDARTVRTGIQFSLGITVDSRLKFYAGL